MSDARLREWLELSRRVLDAEPRDRAEELVQAERRRAELRNSLTEDPPTKPTSPELADALQRSEKAVLALADALCREAGRRLAELQRIRGAARDYRPTRGSLPAFVSRSI